MTKDRLFKKEYAKELFAIAKEDLHGARILFPSDLKRQEIALIQVQQAIEKSLKSLLCWLEKPVPLVHSIAILLERLPAGTTPPYSEELEDFSQFATIRRYEEGVVLFTKDEIKGALEVASEVLKWVNNQIK